MELKIKISDKKVYDSLVQFLKSIGMAIEIFPEEKIQNGKKHKNIQSLNFKDVNLKTKGNKFSREEDNER